MANSRYLHGLAITATSIALCLLCSCDSGSDGAGGEAGQPQASHQEAAMETAKISDLSSHDSGAVTYEGKLFSGRAIKRDADGNLAEERHYFEGYLQGSVRVFNADGTPKSDTQFEKGVANGISFEWDANREMTQILYKDGAEVQRATRPKPPASPPVGD